MNIGVDAYCLYNKQNTGIGSYILGVLCELSKYDKNNRYYLYTPDVYHKSVAEDIERNDNFETKRVNGIFKGSRRIWLQSPQLLKEIKKDKIDLFFGGGEYIPSFLPKNIIAVSTIHDLVFKLFPETVSLVNKIFYKIFFPLCLRRTDHFITISNNSKRDIHEILKIKNDKISVVYNRINLCKFHPNKSDKEDIILFIGTLQPRKNLVNLLRAYNKIAMKVKEKLIIVGASGWKNSELSTYIDNLDSEVRKKIEFKGYLDDAKVVELYQKARLFVAPSLHEGFGLINIEAMASGTPVLTSKRGAVYEVCKEYVEYADPLSEDDIASKIIGILSDPKRQNDLIKSGLKYVKKYDSKNTGPEYIDLFNTISNLYRKDH